MQCARKTLLRTAERINATCLDDLANTLKVSRQAVQQRAIYHGIYDELKQIFKQNKPVLLPQTYGIIVFHKGNDKIYWFSRNNVRAVAKTVQSKFKHYNLSFIPVADSQSVVIECLRIRFKDSKSRLLFEKDERFPYISFVKKYKIYRVYAPISQKHIGSAIKFKDAVKILKQYVLYDKKNEHISFIETVSRDELHKLYVEKKINLQGIAELMNTSASTIYVTLKQLQIPIKNVGRPRNDN